MSKISSVYRSKLPYQWEAGSYNGMQHSEALGYVKPDDDPACMQCGHHKSRHVKKTGRCKGVSRSDSCTCMKFQATALRLKP